ncbi:MAG TPA: PEGA domain-containing protein [Myxococcales bacterium]|jgi:hypothetical protein|nr:PEGA domain-containing protein [Myxococcales bacterium]
MAPRRLLLLSLLLLAYAPAAWPAGDESDDLLAPLTPADNKAKRKRKKVPPPPPPVVEKKSVPLEPLAATAKLAVHLPDTPGGPLKNAHLYVDDKEVGVLPVEAVDATPGDHKVTVKRLGYAPFNATVKVKDSGVTELMATLEPLAAVVTVTADVAGAEAFVDGKSYGPAPLTDAVLAPGNHQLRLKKDGYEEANQAVSVKAGQDYAFRMTLKPAAVARTDRPERARVEPRSLPMPPPPATSTGTAAMTSRVERERDEGTPWYGQWYVWAGGAALVAGAAAGGAAIALQPRSPCGDRYCDACINPPPSLEQFCHGPAVVRFPLMVGFGVPVK